jgi:TPP-dependent 2-oxoacid decarboxylase
MNSNELRKQAEIEENDLKALGLYTKVLREERFERFENYKDKLLQAGYNLTEFESQGKFTIEPTKFGVVDFYPKSNKILIRKNNKWITGGIKWIINNLLKLN